MKTRFEEVIEAAQFIAEDARRAGLETSVRYIMELLPGAEPLTTRAALHTLCTMLACRRHARDISADLRASVLAQLQSMSEQSFVMHMIISLRGYLDDPSLLPSVSSSPEFVDHPIWCIAVGWQANPTATSWLRRQLNAPNASVRREAAVSLAMVADLSGVHELNSTLPRSWKEDYVSMISAVALSRLGQSDGIHFLLASAAECLSESSPKRENFLANVRTAVDRVEPDVSTAESDWWPAYLSRILTRLAVNASERH